ncbi:hypothetical protein RJT34_07465 [Clitoria ternatea]|uniref:B-like cyclin n=1 Tax=Clitoria ternatea TaxID=43366 RepID=A0AAN9K3G0_CLITE
MTIRTRKSKRKLHPEPPSRTISKKLRSKLPRRRRQEISPVLLTSVRFSISREDPRFSVDSSSGSDFAGGGVEVSCNSSRASAVFADKGNTNSVNRLSSEFSRNRRFEKRKENEVAEVSETSCVDSNSGVQERGRSLILKFRRESNKPTENDDVSEVRMKSEITCEKPFNSKSGNGNLKISSELNQNDVVSFSSGVRATSFEKEKNRVKENRASESEYSQENCADLIAQSMVKQESDNNGVVSDLACSEQLQFSYCDDESEYCSSQGTVFSDLHSEIFPECSQLQFSDYTPSLFVDSGSQFSQGSVGDTPSPMYSMFLQYRNEFSALGASQEFSTSSSDADKFARFEDSEDEDSYQMLRKRERRQVFVLNYSERYFSTTDFGEMVLQQRAQMVHWIVEQSYRKQLRQETMFLGVNLFDRFLSKGYFKAKRKLQIVGIACLTFYLKAVNADAAMEKRVKYLAVLAVSAHEQLCYWPSTVAAALVILACLEVNQNASHRVIRIHVRSKYETLHDCIEILVGMEKLATQYSLVAIVPNHPKTYDFLMPG